MFQEVCYIKKVYLFPELGALVQRAMDGRRCGPLFLARRYAGGEAQPSLAGMDAGALAVQLDVRIQETVDRTGENLHRAALAKTARQLWRDMGAITVPHEFSSALASPFARSVYYSRSP